MMLKTLRVILPALTLLVPAPPASACPQCRAGIARQVRAGIYDDQFAFNVFATLMPFGIFLGIAAAIHFGVPAWPADRMRRPCGGASPVNEESPCEAQPIAAR